MSSLAKSSLQLFRRRIRIPYAVAASSSSTSPTLSTFSSSLVLFRSRKPQAQQPQFSTNAAARVDLEDETEEYHSSQQQQQNKSQRKVSRPRLETLRQQLKNETQTSSSSLSSTPPSLTKYVSTTNKKASSQPKESPSSLPEDIHQLLEQLKAMPMPTEPLKDKFGRHHSYLRISLSEKCNLRCLYCMPEDGVPLQPQSHLLSNEEIMKLATWFVHEGVSKIRLTGGEPLLRKDLLELISNLNTLQELEQIGMTTNGVTLSKHLPALVDAGLSHVNISLDSLNADKFARLTRRPPSYHDRVLQAIEDCATLLPHRTKINCVVMPDNVDELEDFCKLTQQMPIDVRFIEYMPFNDNQWGTEGFVSYQDMQNKLSGRLQRLEDGPNDTTKWWTLQEDNISTTTASSNDTTIAGRIGFITSMSEHFCGTCNRLRITADGKLKVCLFGKTEVSLRDVMRYYTNDKNTAEEEEAAALQKLIHYAVQRKHFKLGGHKDMEDLQAHSTENRPMTLIGG